MPVGRGGDTAGLPELVSGLRAYFARQCEMMQGYIKDPATRAEYAGIITGWLADIDELLGPL